MKFIFKTSATMKDYNRDKWYIDDGIIREKIIAADSTAEALDIYVKLVERDDYTTITKNAIKNKAAMYIDNESGDADILYFLNNSSRAGKVLHAYPCPTWAEAQRLAEEWNAKR